MPMLPQGPLTTKPRTKPKPKPKAKPKPRRKPRAKRNPRKKPVVEVQLATLEALALPQPRFVTTLIMKVVKRVTIAILNINLFRRQRRSFSPSRLVQVRPAKAKVRKVVADLLARTRVPRALAAERALALVVNGAHIFLKRPDALLGINVNLPTMIRRLSRPLRRRRRRNGNDSIAHGMFVALAVV
jgi:hypothetical protein